MNIEQMPQNEEIRKAMQEIARRRPGKNRLVYDRVSKTIVSISSTGVKTPIGITLQDGDNI